MKRLSHGGPGLAAAWSHVTSSGHCRCEVPGRPPWRQVGRGPEFTGEVQSGDRALGATRVERVLNVVSLHSSLECHHRSPKPNFSCSGWATHWLLPPLPPLLVGVSSGPTQVRADTAAKGTLLRGMSGHGMMKVALSLVIGGERKMEPGLWRAALARTTRA